MDRKKLFLLVGALIVAIGTAFAARSLLSGGAPTPQAEAAAKIESGPKVLVAKRALPLGTIITADAIGYQPWPKDLVQDAYFVEGEADMAKMLGTVVRQPITAGEPVTRGSLVSPGDRGFLAAALGPGMRAVTIAVSDHTAVAGFVFPGDHIDLVLTQSVKGAENQAALQTSETILKNLRVLATDQSTEQETVDGKTRVHTFGTVTVEVTPKIAEKIAVAQTLGTISLSLRSIADNSADLEQALASGQVKIPAGATKADEEKLIKQAMHQPVENGSSFVTGGDVSRFQRKTMPSMVPAGFGTHGMAAGAPPMAAPAGAPIIINRGPIVRITRGKDTETVAVGGN